MIRSLLRFGLGLYAGLQGALALAYPVADCCNSSPPAGTFQYCIVDANILLSAGSLAQDDYTTASVTTLLPATSSATYTNATQFSSLSFPVIKACARNSANWRSAKLTFPSASTINNGASGSINQLTLNYDSTSYVTAFTSGTMVAGFSAPNYCCQFAPASGTPAWRRCFMRIGGKISLVAAQNGGTYNNPSLITVTITPYNTNNCT